MSTDEWQWIIWGIGIFFVIQHIVSISNKWAGLILANIIMWSCLFCSLDFFTETLKNLGLGI